MSGKLGRLKGLIKEHFKILEQNDEEFIPGKTEIPLAVPSYSWEEVSEAVGVMFSRWVAMGEKVRQFENLFAHYTGVNNAVMVNSGSSANLLAMSILTNPRLRQLKRGDEIITPAVTWATTVFPMINVGATPVLVDVDHETYTIDLEEVEKAITKKTRVIMPVHLLGYPCNMKRIMEIAQEHDLIVVEDACEAHGAECFGKKVGSFGDMATFSFYASHHITTMEGGMLVTSNDEYFELAKTLRSNGWIRDLRDREQIIKEYPEIDSRFLFVNIGFNIRPTDVQGAFGIHQIKKMDFFIKVRQENARYWNRRLGDYSDYFILPEKRKGFKHVYFGYPITIRPDAPFDRPKLVSYLEQKGIATRPIMAGNIAEQPAMSLFDHRQVGSLNNSKLIMRNSFFFGNHHKIDKRKREYVADSIIEFVEDKLWLEL